MIPEGEARPKPGLVGRKAGEIALSPALESRMVSDAGGAVQGSAHCTQGTTVSPAFIALIAAPLLFGHQYVR
jgi:hypothetical protein